MSLENTLNSIDLLVKPRDDKIKNDIVKLPICEVMSKYGFTHQRVIDYRREIERYCVRQ